jgi:hypothetical protein
MWGQCTVLGNTHSDNEDILDLRGSHGEDLEIVVQDEKCRE